VVARWLVASSSSTCPDNPCGSTTEQRRHRDFFAAARNHRGGRRCRYFRCTPRSLASLYDCRLERIEIDHQKSRSARCRASSSLAHGRRLSLIASSPPCTLGCSVLTLPSIISGKPVSSETSVTFNPAAAIALAVPPVENEDRRRGRPSAAGEFDQSGFIGHGQQKRWVTRRGWSVMLQSCRISPPGSTVCKSWKTAKVAVSVEIDRQSARWVNLLPLWGRGRGGGIRESGACCYTLP